MKKAKSKPKAMTKSIYKKVMAKEISLDGRSRLSRQQRQLRKKLTESLGDRLSPEVSIIVERIVFKTLHLKQIEEKVLNGENKAGDYLISLSNSLRLDLQHVGLNRDFSKARPPANPEGEGSLDLSLLTLPELRIFREFLKKAMGYPPMPDSELRVILEDALRDFEPRLLGAPKDGNGGDLE